MRRGCWWRSESPTAARPGRCRGCQQTSPLLLLLQPPRLGPPRLRGTELEKATSKSEPNPQLKMTPESAESGSGLRRLLSACFPLV